MPAHVPVYSCIHVDVCIFKVGNGSIIETLVCTLIVPTCISLNSDNVLFYILLSHIASLVSSTAASPMLSLVMTRLSISSVPCPCVMASWLNSTNCSFFRLNLQISTTFKLSLFLDLYTYLFLVY